MGDIGRPITAQSSSLPPAQPSYIFRGHTAQIHALHFIRRNLALLSGDADGWVVLWDVPIKRARAVWKPHDGPILGLGTWDEQRIITHGRDSKLHVWQLKREDEATLSQVLPIDDATTERRQPWLLHTLTVNTMNFCAFAMCNQLSQEVNDPTNDILVATPGVQDGHINITSLPDEARFATIPTPKATSTGMLMAIGLLYLDSDSRLVILASYESGHAALWQQNTSQRWECIYIHKAHSQPVMSLDYALELGCFFTSSADAVIARHPLSGDENSTKSVQTKHAGQQSLTVRTDEKIFATAGWDGRVRVYSPKSLKELAVLKWHKEGCYAVAFAAVDDQTTVTGGSTFADKNASIVPRNLTVSEQRVQKARSTHWLAAGSKDGKISLWDIY